MANLVSFSLLTLKGHASMRPRRTTAMEAGNADIAGANIGLHPVASLSRIHATATYLHPVGKKNRPFYGAV